MKKLIHPSQGKHFYTELIETSHISLALGEMDLSQEERVHLIALAESNLHNTILDAVLSELSEEDKKTFLHHVVHNEHEKVWDLLKAKVANIEEKIKSAAESIKNELHQDIKDAKAK